MTYAVVVVRRVRGTERMWRLLIIAGMASWLFDEVLWWSNRVATGSDTAPWPGVAAYFLPPVFSLAAMLLLARSGGARTDVQEDPLRGPRIITVLDGLIAALSFSILVYIAGFGDRTGEVLPRSDNTAVLLAYSAHELVVVVVAMLIAVSYRPDRPYRMNYLLLAVGVAGGDLWGGSASSWDRC